MTLSPQDQRVRDTLHLVTSTLAEVEERPGQDEMAMTIARSIDKRRHLVVQAGTGTGKTLGYLIPAVLSGKRTVVVMAGDYLPLSPSSFAVKGPGPPS